MNVRALDSRSCIPISQAACLLPYLQPLFGVQCWVQACINLLQERCQGAFPVPRYQLSKQRVGGVLLRLTVVERIESTRVAAVVATSNVRAEFRARGILRIATYGSVEYCISRYVRVGRGAA